MKNLKYERLTQGDSMNDFPNFRGLRDTLDILKTGDYSISRYGDGELFLMYGRPLKFQKNDPILAERLKDILRSCSGKHLVGIPSYFFSLNEHPYINRRYLRRFLNQYRSRIMKSLNLDKTYYDTMISQYFAIKRDDVWLQNYFDELRMIWKDRDIVIVKGKDSETDQEFDIYDNASSVNYVLGPSINAFSSYGEILEDVKKYPKNVMMILALGPTATVLAYDLSLAGYKALDLGHLGKSYDWFKKNKDINEASEPFFPV